MLMDEPFASVDAQTRRKLQEDLTAILEANRPTVFFVRMTSRRPCSSLIALWS